MTEVVLVTTWVLCGIAAAVVAGARNRSQPTWLLLGCLMGVFALILVCALPALPPPPLPPETEPPLAGIAFGSIVLLMILAAVVVIAVD